MNDKLGLGSVFAIKETGQLFMVVGYDAYNTENDITYEYLCVDAVLGTTGGLGFVGIGSELIGDVLFE